MSVHYISIVDSYVSSKEAPKASNKVLRLLMDKEIVESTLSNCCLHSATLGYRPGLNFLSATDIVESSGAANCNYNDFIGFQVNGLEVSVERSVVYDAYVDPGIARCPNCAEDSSFNEAWNQAISDWHSGNDAATLFCEHCEKQSEFAMWDHLKACAVGNLALKFWNWPELSDKFIETIASTLGNPVNIVVGSV